MSSRSGAIRQPADDGSSFDISKRSPEQIAQLFARWKEQRKRLVLDAEQGAGEQNSAAPQVVRFMPAERAAAQPDPKPAPKPANTQQAVPRDRQYSSDFSAILTSGDQAAAQQIKRLRFPAAAITAPARTGHGSGIRWSLAIAVSLIALTAAAGTVLWEQEAPNVRPQAAAAVAAPAQPEAAVQQPAEMPTEIQTAAPLLPAATRLPEAESWSVALLVDPGSGALSPSVEAAQPPMTANHKSIQTTGASTAASGPTRSGPVVQASAEEPGDFATSAGGSTPTAETVREAAPPARQAAGSAERGNERDRLRLDPALEPVPSDGVGATSIAGRQSVDPGATHSAGSNPGGSTAASGGGAVASPTAHGESNPSNPGTADAGSNPDASTGTDSAASSGRKTGSGTSESTDSSASSSSATGNADATDASPGAKGSHKGGAKSGASESDTGSGASSNTGGSAGGAGGNASGSEADPGASGNDSGSSASGNADGSGASADGAADNSSDGAVSGAGGGLHDAVGGALGGAGQAAGGLGKPDGKGLGGKGSGANAGGKGKGKGDKGGKGGKGGGKGKG
jgi:hypothetical protein